MPLLYNANLRFVRRSLAVLVVLGPCLSGCGSKHPEIAPVNGVVRYQGKPLPDAYVCFTPKAGRSASGVTGSDGKFSLSTYENNDGARIGLHCVTITASKDTSKSRRPVDYNTDDTTAYVQLSLIPLKYGNPESSGLEFEVKPGVENHAEFDLTSKP